MTEEIISKITKKMANDVFYNGTSAKDAASILLHYVKDTKSKC